MATRVPSGPSRAALFAASEHTRSTQTDRSPADRRPQRWPDRLAIPTGKIIRKRTTLPMTVHVARRFRHARVRSAAAAMRGVRYHRRRGTRGRGGPRVRARSSPARVISIASMCSCPALVAQPQRCLIHPERRQGRTGARRPSSPRDRGAQRPTGSRRAPQGGDAVQASGGRSTAPSTTSPVFWLTACAVMCWVPGWLAVECTSRMPAVVAT